MRSELKAVAVLAMAFAVAAGCSDPSEPSASAETRVCEGFETTSDGAEVCVLAGDSPCGVGWSEAGRAQGFLLCSDDGVSLDEAALASALAQVCEGGTPSSTGDGTAVCLFADPGKADDSCPEPVATSHVHAGVTVCAARELETVLLDEAVAAGCAGGQVVPVGDAAGCVFITETGFLCPSFLPGTQAVGSWTVCGQADLDAAGARAHGQALCDLADDDLATLVVSDVDAGCAVAITETGFSCPPILTAAFDDGQLGLCGAAGGLSADAADALFTDLCGPGNQFVRADVGGACTVFITETGFQPCPALLPFQSTAEPFATCSAAPLDVGGAARLRLDVCGDNGAMADFGLETLCAYTITETGFLCPDLLPSVFSGPNATVCGRTPDVAQDIVDQGLAFAESPYICGWVQGEDGTPAQRFGGIDATPSGFVASASLSPLLTRLVGVPADNGLMVEGELDTHILTRMNLNGSGRQSNAIATTDSVLNACGQVVGPDGSITLVGLGAGLVTFDAGGVSVSEDLGDTGWYAVRLNPEGVLQWTASAPIANPAPWFDDCTAVGHADGSVTFVHRDDSGALPGEGAYVVRLGDDGAIGWSATVPTRSTGIAGHPSGEVTLVGQGTTGEAIVDGQGANTALTVDAAGDGWVARFAADGGLRWAAVLGGAADDALWGATSVGEEALVAGYVTGTATLSDNGGGVELSTIDDDGGPPVRETVVLRLGADASVTTTLRGTGSDNHEGHAIAVGLDGTTLHLAGLASADVRFGEEGDVAIAVGSNLTFYAQYVATFDLTSGEALSAVQVSDIEPVASKWSLAGHLDGSSTLAVTTLGVGLFGSDAANRVSLGRDVGESMVLVHTPAPECSP